MPNLDEYGYPNDLYSAVQLYLRSVEARRIQNQQSTDDSLSDKTQPTSQGR